MIHWKNKIDKTTNTIPKWGDTKIEKTFLWFPFLNEDGEYYWLGYVSMEYIYAKYFDPILPIESYRWTKQRMIL